MVFEDNGYIYFLPFLSSNPLFYFFTFLPSSPIILSSRALKSSSYFPIRPILPTPLSAFLARFLPKNERMSDSIKKTSDSLIPSFFGERPERFAHNRSFPLSNLSKSLMVAHFW